MPFMLDLYRLSTPDAIGAAAALAATYAALVKRWRIGAAILVVAAIGIRPDHAAVGVALGAVLVLGDRTLWRFAGALIVLSVGTYVAVSHLVGAHDYVTFINFSLIKPRIADLTQLPTAYDPYLVLRAARQYALGDEAFAIVLFLSVAIAVHARRTILDAPYQSFLVALVFGAAKFAIYPAEMSRQIVLSYILILISTVHIMRETSGVPSRAAGARPQ